MTTHTCCDCNQPGDLRPYGPNGAMICHPCMKSGDGREEEATRQFLMQLNGIKGPAVIDGSEAGVYPAQHNDILVKVLGEPKDVQ